MPILCRQVHEINGKQQRSILQRLSMSSNVKALWTWNFLLVGKSSVRELKRTFVTDA